MRAERPGMSAKSGSRRTNQSDLRSATGSITERREPREVLGSGEYQRQVERGDLRDVVLQLGDLVHQMLDPGDVDGLAAAVAEQDRGGLDLAHHRLRVALAQRRDPVGAVLQQLGRRTGDPNDTTGPNNGSSIVATVTGIPGGAFFCTTKPADAGSLIISFRVRHACRISAWVSMLRHTWDRSAARAALGGRLEDDVPAELLPGAQRLADVEDRSTCPTARFRSRPAGCAARPGRGRGRRGARSAPCSRMPGGRGVHTAEEATVPWGCQPHGVPDDGGERPDGGLEAG